MLEWGQPLHAFDYDVLVAARRRQGADDHRAARAGWRDARHARQAGTQADAGEPGHRRHARARSPWPASWAAWKPRSPTKTKNILLESANFDFVSIRRTMKQFNLPSEASVRFSQGIHPETVKPAVERAAELMRQYAGGTVCSGLVDSYPAPLPPQVVELQLEQVRTAARHGFPAEEAGRILRALEFDVDRRPAPDTLRCRGAAASARHPGRGRRPDRGVGPHPRLRRLPTTLLADGCRSSTPTSRSSSRSACATSSSVPACRRSSPTPDDAGEGKPRLRGSQARMCKCRNPISSERVGDARTAFWPACSKWRRATCGTPTTCGSSRSGPVYLPQRGREAAGGAAPAGDRDDRPPRPEFWGDGTARRAGRSISSISRGDRSAGERPAPGRRYVTSRRRPRICIPADRRRCWSAARRSATSASCIRRWREAYGLADATCWRASSTWRRCKR